MLSHHHTALGVVISAQIIQRQPPVAAALLPGEWGGGLIPPATSRNVQLHHRHRSTNSTAAASAIELSWCGATTAFRWGACWLAQAVCQCQITPKMSKASPHVHNCSLGIGCSRPVLHNTSIYNPQLQCRYYVISQMCLCILQWHSGKERRAVCCVADISA